MSCQRMRTSSAPIARTISNAPIMSAGLTRAANPKKRSTDRQCAGDRLVGPAPQCRLEIARIDNHQEDAEGHDQ